MRALLMTRRYARPPTCSMIDMAHRRRRGRRIAVSHDRNLCMTKWRTIRTVAIPAQQVRGGFTLLEAMMATIVLFGVVMCVTSAITAGHQNALEAQNRIAGALAADELMGRIVATPYASVQGTWNGFEESVGSMNDAFGNAMTDRFARVGRRVDLSTINMAVGGSGLQVPGTRVTVEAFDTTNRVLATVTTFIPEPLS